MRGDGLKAFWVIRRDAILDLWRDTPTNQAGIYLTMRSFHAATSALLTIYCETIEKGSFELFAVLFMAGRASC